MVWLEVTKGGHRIVDERLAVGCGLMNALEPGHILVLPHAVLLRRWWDHLPLDAPGTYEVRLRYVNDPAHSWPPCSDESAFAHDAATLTRVRASARCNLCPQR